MSTRWTPGIVRGLDTLTTAAGVFCVLAIDHRDALRAVLPGESDSELVQFKIDLLRGVAADASGVMLEPELSLPQVLIDGALPGTTGFIAALEAQGYMQDPWAGPTAMLAGWSAEQAQAMGASAAKILLAYDPDRTEHAAAQRALVAEVAETVHGLDMALLVEPVAFGMAPQDRPRKVRQSVTELAGLGVDVFKVEFPGDPADPGSWPDACAAVDQAADAPWVLLSAGVTFDQYRDQLEVAFANGCSGFTGGRAIWREAVHAPAGRRAAVMAGQVRAKFGQLQRMANEQAQPWRTVAGLGS